MLASSFGDPVLGVDIHWEMVPMPAPVPTPIPNPFTGIIFDPIGLAAGLVISNAVGAVLGAPFTGPVVYWTAVPATNTGTEAKHLPGHILIPPGTAWAPVPKTPKPVIHPGETPSPPKPVSPENDAVCVFGSKTVSVMGSNAVRLGDMAMSCSEPVRLPSSVVLAVPKGAPILIGGPPSLDLMAAILASLRTRFVSDSLHALISRMRPSRFRNFLNRAVCFFTGHPVDVASGKVMTHLVDAELPGPLPLKIERVYSSAFASRSGPLGHGWSHSLHQLIWRERGKVVYLAEDGREIEFDTFDFPDHRIHPGEALWHPIDRLTLRCKEGDRWEIEDHDGIVREFAPVPGSGGVRSLIQRIRSRCRFHEILFEYDERGRLRWVRDSGGRLINLEHDEKDRLVALKLPVPEGRGWDVHRRYEYDRQGDLVRIIDALGASWSFEYATHLLTRETDRTGLSFYFIYDGFGEDAWCVRTWGDGGIYDHVIDYDKKNHITYVTNSLGHTTQYHMNVAGQVTKIVDPLGGETKYEYDARTLQRTIESNSLGQRTCYLYDELGRQTAVVDPAGNRREVHYDEAGNAVTLIDQGGNRWGREYDRRGNATAVIDPAGNRWEYHLDSRGFPIAVKDPLGREICLEWDREGNLHCRIDREGGQTRFEYDHLGRVVKRVDAMGGETRLTWDEGGRLSRVRYPRRGDFLFRYDPEGNVVEAIDPLGRIRRNNYGPRGLLRWVEEPTGAVTEYTYDKEGRVSGVQDARGRNWKFRRDPLGNIFSEENFEGRRLEYKYDSARRLIAAINAKGEQTVYQRDPLGRLLKRIYHDGTEEVFKYDPRGLLINTENADAKIAWVYDPVGRPISEAINGQAIASQYDPLGNRIARISPYGCLLTLEYHPESGLKQVNDPQGLLMQLGYNRLGREIDRTLPGEVICKRDYLSTGELASSLTERRNRTLISRSYRYDSAGQLEEIKEGEAITRFRHDLDGRLIAAAYPDRLIEEYLYDAAGNVPGIPQRLPLSHSGFTAQADGWLLQYDEDGNLIEKSNTDNHYRYEYSAAGRLVRVVKNGKEVIEFAYDPLGRRIKKATAAATVEYVWDGDVLLGERRLSLEGKELAKQEYIFLPKTFEPAAVLAGEEAYLLECDQVGTPRAATNRKGEIVWEAAYHPFGKVKAEKGLVGRIPFRFPGQTADPETGLYYNRFRYYDPELRMYLSPDPIGLHGGVAAYNYAKDPLGWIDPYGLTECVSTPGGRPLTQHAKESLPRHGFTPPFGRIDDIIDNASRVATQADGARVHIQRTGGRNRLYDIVIESEEGIVTALQNLTPHEIRNLERTYGWI